MLVNFLHLFAVSAIACALSLLLTPLAREGMRRLGAIDLPDPRRVNRVPVPRGGGLAVVVAVFASLALAWCFWRDLFVLSNFAKLMPWFVAASALLVGTGFVDDLRGVSPKLKLLAQIVAAAIMCWGGARLTLPQAWGAWGSSPWVYIPLTLVWYIGVVNAFNLIDGLDGLSSGLAILAAAGMIGVLAIGDPARTPIVAFAFIGALLGFLRYNYNPASVFLGDSGSLFVGLTLATLALSSRCGDAFLISVGVPALCLGVPLIDTMLAIVRRSLRYILLRTEGEDATGVMTADRMHTHHRLLNWAHGNQRRAVWCIYGFAVILLALAFVLLTLRSTKTAVFLIGFLAFCTVIVRMMTDVELWDAGHLLSRPGKRLGNRNLSIPYYLFADTASMCGLFCLLRFLLKAQLPSLGTMQWVPFLLAYAVPVFLCLVAVKAYTRIWVRGSRWDAVAIILAIGFGSLVSHLILTICTPTMNPGLRTFHILWALILTLPVLGVRICRNAFLQWLAGRENIRLCHRSESDSSIERVLFYGAGVNLTAYLTLVDINVTTNRVALLAVLDDDIGLRGRYMRNLPILGPLELLEEKKLLERLRPTKIIVTTPAIGDERLADIRDFCKANGLRLSRFSTQENDIA